MTALWVPIHSSPVSFSLSEYCTLLTPDHGEDWGLAAVELAADVAEWGKGKI